MSISQNFPNTRPSLNLNFARSKTLDPRITFTRTSTGTYVDESGVIRTAVADEPRFDHDPVTGESLGLLIEEGRSNIKIRSEELQSDFSRAQITTISQNEIISPDGLQTADGIVPNVTLTAHYLDKVLTSTSGITASQNICCSAFFKKGVGRDVLLQIYEESGNAYHGVQFNFETETLTFRNSNEYTNGGGVTTDYGVIKYPNGWYRLWVAGYPNTTTTGRRYRIRLTDASGVPDFSGDAVSSYVYSWGVQVEAGAFPTSYIPTQGSTATRTKEYPTISGTDFTDFYNPSEGTFYVRYSMKGYYATDGFNRIFEISDGGSTNRFSALLRGINDDIYEGAVWGINFNTSLITFGDFYTYIVGYKENDFQRYAIDRNGNIDSNTDTSVEVSSFIPTELNIGYQADGDSRQLDGHISQLLYYPTRLPNSQLQTLTK